MAFIIPSKNIYDSNTPIIKNNFVNKIEVASQNVSIAKEYDTVGFTYNSAINQSGYIIPENSTTKVFDFDSIRTLASTAYATASFASITPIYCNFGSASNPIKIPKSNNNLRILNIPFGEGNLDYSVLGLIKTYSLTKSPIVSIKNERKSNGTILVDAKNIMTLKSDDSANDVVVLNNEKDNQQISLTTQYTSPNNELISKVTSPDSGVTSILFELRSMASANIIDNSNITLQNEDDNYYYVYFTLLVGYIADYAEYKSPNGINVANFDTSEDYYNFQLTMTGKRIETYPNQLEMRFRGEVIKLNIETQNIIVGDSSSTNGLSINTNEFIQGAVLDQSVSNNFKNVIKEYENGKRTIELLCDINEYFRLPKEYQELEYINLNYAPMIDTGVSGGSNANYEIVFVPKMDSGYDFDQYFAGKRSSPIPKIYRDNFSLVLSVQNKTYVCERKVDEKIHINVMPNGKISINNDFTATLSSYEGSGWGDKTWLIGNGQDENHSSSMLLYSLKMRNGTETIRDFVPCYRKSDNKIGLYDLVTKAFFENQGSGKIVASDPLHYKNKVFEDSEEIIPMVYTARGEDEPIFKDQYGKAKKFKVVGNNIFFDGAVWQKIYAQETL